MLPFLSTNDKKHIVTPPQLRIDFVFISWIICGHVFCSHLYSHRACEHVLCPTHTEATVICHNLFEMTIFVSTLAAYISIQKQTESERCRIARSIFLKTYFGVILLRSCEISSEMTKCPFIRGVHVFVAPANTKNVILSHESHTWITLLSLYL